MRQLTEGWKEGRGQSIGAGRLKTGLLIRNLAQIHSFWNNLEIRKKDEASANPRDF